MAPKSALRPSKFVKIAAGTGIAFVGAQFAWGSERFYNEVFMPVVHRCTDAETAHRWAVKMAAYGLLPRFGENHKDYATLHCTFLDMKLKNPIGIAAGFDKNGEAITALQNSGLGFVEIGSVTPRPQPGNAKPRVFRLLEDRAIINRYGFNSDGVGVVSERVKKSHSSDSKVPLGVNLGKNADSNSAQLDYEIGCNYFANDCEYLVVNVSSPNTKNLRSLQSKDELLKILETTRRGIDRIVQDKEPKPKLLVKITSDLSASELRDIAKIVSDKNNQVDGIIISNTTIQRPESLQSKHKTETGGLSGAPLKDMSTQCISEMYKLTDGRVPIIGCGGIESGLDAYEKISAGASVVQFYTALVYQGFPAIGRIKRELNDELLKNGYTSVESAIGSDHKKLLNESSKQNLKSWWQFW